MRVTPFLISVLFLLSSCSGVPPATGTGGPGSMLQFDTCSSDADCEPGISCASNGRCLPDGICAADVDCGSSEYCAASNECEPRPSCETSGSCPGGMFCSGSGECIADGTCEVDDDCDSGTFCSVTDVCIADDTCLASSDCSVPGTICDAGSCVPGSACGVEQFDAEPVVPNFLIVLDRSGSMDNEIDGVRKWDAAVGAIDGIINVYADGIRWGLTAFPSPGTCGVTQFPFNIDDGNGPLIQSFLDDTLGSGNSWSPQGGTPLSLAMAQAATDPALDDVDHPSFILLITDGMQTCVGSSTVEEHNEVTRSTIEDLHDDRDVTTFVMGFASQGSSSIDPDALNSFAEAGGAPLPGETKFLAAQDGTQLQEQIEEIAGSIASCNYELAEIPEDFDHVYVFFNTEQSVPRDTNQLDGWDGYMTSGGNAAIRFYGPKCDQLKDGSVEDVDIVIGCPPPTGN